MPETALNTPQSRQEPATPARRHRKRARAERDAYYAHAAYYGLYLRHVEGLAADEAAVLVMERYPLARPFLERLTRRAVLDPLAGDA